MKQQEEFVQNEEFHYQLDFYWQAIALYAVALLGYSFLRGTIVGHQFTFVFYDPIVLLLLTFVIASCLFVLTNGFMRRSVVIGPDFITFRNRFRERTFTKEDILHISIDREQMIKLPGAPRVIKIRLAHRRRWLRIRPALYEQDNELVHALVQLKRRLAH